MSPEDLEMWKESVFEYTRMVETLVDDRVAIKDLISNHLKQFFDYDEISFDDLFNRIILKWSYGNDPVIKVDELDGLNMDFIISHFILNKQIMELLSRCIHLGYLKRE